MQRIKIIHVPIFRRRDFTLPLEMVLRQNFKVG